MAMNYRNILPKNVFKRKKRVGYTDVIPSWHVAKKPSFSKVTWTQEIVDMSTLLYKIIYFSIYYQPWIFDKPNIQINLLINMVRQSYIVFNALPTRGSLELSTRNNFLLSCVEFSRISNFYLRTLILFASLMFHIL